MLERTNRSLDEVKVIELNEAFAAQSLAVIDDLGLDQAKVNPNGGAIALGHPIAATGSVLVAKILDDMEDRDLSLGLVTLCIGGGQGIALLLERDWLADLPTRPVGVLTRKAAGSVKPSCGRSVALSG